MDMNKLMKEAQKMQRKLAEQQEQLALQTFEAASGGGMVTAKVNGKHELLELKIDPEVVNKEDVGMLQDLVIAAINEAQHRAQEETQKSLSGLMGGMQIPGMF